MVARGGSPARPAFLFAGCKLVQKRHWIEYSQCRELVLKTLCVRICLIHQVKQVSVSGDDQLCICRHSKIDVMSVVRIARINERFGKSLQDYSDSLEGAKKFIHMLLTKLQLADYLWSINRFTQLPE